MQKYFNVFLEFNHQKLYSLIEETIKSRSKAYICVVDANVLTMAQSNQQYRDVLNAATINTCDGSSIAMLAGWAHHKKLRALNGPEIFEHYIEKNYRQILLGSTPETADRIKAVLSNKNIHSSHLETFSLPFIPVEQFNYQAIAKAINNLQPDIIWVSLGAPKQEVFMNKLMPLLNQGVMFGIGAAFNFYIGELNIPRFRLGSLKFIWLNRLINEPKKLIRRILPYVAIMPRLYVEERRKLKSKSIPL